MIRWKLYNVAKRYVEIIEEIEKTADRELLAELERAMNLEAVAKAYVDCVELEERAARESLSITEDLGVLRADLHALLMETLRQAGVSFADRADAASIAFNIARGKHPVH